MYLELNEKQACLNKLVCSVENFLWFYSVNFKIHIIYDFRVSILKSYISWMVGPIFNLFFLKCSFGRPFVRLDDRLFVWTIVRSFGRSLKQLSFFSGPLISWINEILKLKNFGNFRVIFGYYPTFTRTRLLGYPTYKKSGTGKLGYGYYPRVIFTRFFTRHTLVWGSTFSKKISMGGG